MTVIPIYRCAAADAQPVGRPGSVVAMRCFDLLKRLRFWNARCAGSVVLIARYTGRDTDARCAARPFWAA